MSARGGEAQRIRDRIAAGSRVLVAVAGPNGAGKSTFGKMFFDPLGIRVVNPDAIGSALFPDSPRVMQRTEQGGHDVPDEKIASRFPRVLANLAQALAFVDYAFLFDNSSADEPYRFVAELRAGRIVRRGTIRPRWLASLGR